MRKSIYTSKFSHLFVPGVFLIFCASLMYAKEPKMDTNVPFGWCVVPSSVGEPPLSRQQVVTTTGGNDGRVVRASSRSDFGYLCTSSEPLVILAEGSHGVISVGSNKTLVGVGRDAAGHFILNKSSNIIIRNFVITGKGGDGINVAGASHVWIDHCDLSNCGDGLIDIVNGADKIVVSWSKFSHHVKTMLINSGTKKPIDFGRLSVSLTHNFFDGTDQRNPRAGIGKLHVLNCYYKSCGKTTSTGYGIHVYWEIKAIIERCNFIDTEDAISHHRPELPHLSPGYCYLIDNKVDAISKIGLKSETEKDKILQIDDYYMYDWMVLDADKVPDIVSKGAGTGTEWSKIGHIPIPGQGAVNISTNPTLKWTKVGLETIFKVYFGKTFPPPERETIVGHSYKPGKLDKGTVYYWKINDNDVWKFRTEGEAPANVTHSVSISSSPDALTFYLNPARSELKLKLAGNYSGTGVRDLIVYDCLGKVIRTEKTSGKEHTMNVKTLPCGVYYISLTGKEGNAYKKFIRN